MSGQVLHGNDIVLQKIKDFIFIVKEIIEIKKMFHGAILVYKESKVEVIL